MKKILCPGELLIDFVSTDRGNCLSEVSNFEKKAGGAPANVAAALKKFGCEPYIYASVGSDSFGKYLKEVVRTNELSLEYVNDNKELPTTLAFVNITAYGDRNFEFFRGADQDLEINDIEDFKDIDCFHFSSATAFLGDNLYDTYEELLNYAFNNNKVITFDLNYRDTLFPVITKDYVDKAKLFISKSDVVKLSDEEAMLFSDKDDLKVIGQDIMKQGCKLLVITLGKEGSLLFYNNEVIKYNIIKLDMVDATGAGDAFIGGFISKYLELDELNKENLDTVMNYASISGALTTQKLGAFDSIPTREEIKEFALNYNRNI